MIDKQTYLEEIENKDSGYFAGSACLLSLLPLLKSYFSGFDNQQIYYDVEELVMTLSIEDGQLFALSISKEELTEEQNIFIENAFQHYQVIVFLLQDIIQNLEEEGKEKEVVFLKQHYHLLVHLWMINIEAFEKKEYIPSYLSYFKNEVLSIINGESKE